MRVRVVVRVASAAMRRCAVLAVSGQRNIAHTTLSAATAQRR